MFLAFDQGGELHFFLLFVTIEAATLLKMLQIIPDVSGWKYTGTAKIRDDHANVWEYSRRYIIHIHWTLSAPHRQAIAENVIADA